MGNCSPAAGQKLLDIVPDGRELIIQAQLKPSDADDAYPGQKAQVRFISIHNRSLPLFTGTVRTVSAHRVQVSSLRAHA